MNWCHFINFWGQVLNWCQLINIWGHVLLIIYEDEDDDEQSQPEGDDGDEDDSESERFDRDIASVTSSLDVCLISE